MGIEKYKEYKNVLESLKRGEAHGVIFAVEHGDTWHHRAIERFMARAKEMGIPAQLLEESLDEEHIPKEAYLRKLALIEEMGRVAKKHGITNKQLYELSTEEAIKAEQKALEMGIKMLEEGKVNKALLLQKLAEGISKFRRPQTRERYMVMNRWKKWGAWAADSGTLKEMMRIAMQERYNYEPLWRTRNLTMLKNLKKAKFAGKIPVLVTGALHAEEIKKLAEKQGIKLLVVRPKSGASAGEKWIDKKEYGKLVRKP